MRSTLKKHSLALATLLAFAALPVAGASADTASEIRALKARLKQLENQVSAQRSAPPVNPALAHRKGPIEVVTPYPDKFYYKGITLTPGGYFAAEGLWRSRFLGQDMGTTWNSIPFGNSIVGHTNEARLSARATRLSMLAEGHVDPDTVLQGYAEVDFQGAAQTANSNATNSYQPRIRHLLINIDWNDVGVHVTAGQTWSLVTMNSDSIKWNTTIQPPTIDQTYLPGYVYARQPQFRVTKNLPYGFTAAVAIENPALNLGTSTASGLPAATFYSAASAPFPGAGIPGAYFSAGSGQFNSLVNYGLTHVPDITGKLAYDAVYWDRKIHVEGWGLLRDFTDRAWFGNHSVWGGTGGAGVYVELWPKLLELHMSGSIGNGTGRYVAGGLPDATFGPTGRLVPLGERTILLGLIGHLTPQTDVYVYGGGEFMNAKSQFVKLPGTAPSTLLAYGYGNFAYTNTTCDFEPGLLTPTPFAPGCSGQTKSLRSITTGIWHTFYSGNYGKLKGGAQYNYTERNGFVGFGATPKGVESTIMTSLRWFPF